MYVRLRSHYIVKNQIRVFIFLQEFVKNLRIHILVLKIFADSGQTGTYVLILHINTWLFFLFTFSSLISWSQRQNYFTRVGLISFFFGCVCEIS